MRTAQKSLCTLRTTNIFTEHLHTNTLTFLVLELQHMLEMPPSRHVLVDVYLAYTFCVCCENVLGPSEYMSSHRARQVTFASLCIIRFVCD